MFSEEEEMEMRDNRVEKTISLRSSTIKPRRSYLPSAKGIFYLSLLVSLVASIVWREGKVFAGYCDTHSPTNSLLLARTDSLIDITLSSPPALIVLSTLNKFGFLPPCTPCPPHAICAEGKLITCETDYVIVPHPLRLGGLLPFGSSCRPDSKRLMAIAQQASIIAQTLRQTRGKIICNSRKERTRLKEGKSVEWVYGIGEQELLVGLLAKIEIEEGMSDEGLIEIGRAALGELIRHREVSSSIEEYVLPPPFLPPILVGAGDEGES